MARSLLLRRVAPLATLSAIALGGFAAPADAAVYTIGPTSLGPDAITPGVVQNYGTDDETFINRDLPLGSVPSIGTAGDLITWRANVGTTGAIRLVVLHPTGSPGEYTVTAVDDQVAGTTGVNTFTPSTPLPIGANDTIGIVQLPGGALPRYGDDPSTATWVKSGALAPMSPTTGETFTAPVAPAVVTLYNADVDDAFVPPSTDPDPVDTTPTTPTPDKQVVKEEEKKADEPAPAAPRAATPAPAFQPIAPAGPTAFRVIRFAAPATTGSAGAQNQGRLELDVPGPGRIETQGIAVEAPKGARGAAAKSYKVFARTTVVEKAGRVSLDVTLPRESLRVLARRGLLRVNVSARYVPATGEAVETRRTVTLKAFSVLELASVKHTAGRSAARVVARVPSAGVLRVVARAGDTTLGTTSVRVTARGERALTVKLDPTAVAKARKAGDTQVRLSAVLRRPGADAASRTRTLGL